MTTEQSTTPEPVEPTQPAQAAQPTQTAQPAQAVEPIPAVEPVQPVDSLEPVDSAPESASDAAPKKRVRRGRIAAIAGSVLLVGAVIGGAGYTVVTVQDADRDAGAPVWKFPKATKEDAKKAKATSGLAAMLVPYEGEGEGWSRGPDIAEFGSDAALSGGEAAALRKESISDLPRSQRRRLEKEIDKQHTKGMVMRSYLSTANASDSTAYAERAFTVSIELMQMEDKTAVRNMSTFQNEFFDALSIFRSGPKIEGHKNAKCFLPPKDKEEKLDMMVCSAYEGDVLVSVTAEAAKPLNTKGVASLLREQLDRITEPGEAV
ncbi:hypothetical protein GCM10011579_025680 [Streptomyces albiflavescens]|uniref:Secreted protein n=1 Tax=Streptomyces albiflavescens TaxID=1623582 RepID=A0A918D322_9ACTN|nr:hypothetical protein [Streptomyces albiflavescens]GGN60470.1 hypothetical protein GCM10011579_025680 [Streptomyces albiflavescens]